MWHLISIIVLSISSNYTLSDIEAIDIPFYNSLKYVLENDPEPLELTFTVLEEVFGQQSEYELRPGGASISVSDENKQEYVDLMVQWRLSNGILPQTESIVKGLREMIPPKYLDAFDAQELEWVIAGTPEINLEDWKNNTVYWGGELASYYSGKLLREKTFTDLGPFTKLFLANIACAHNPLLFWSIASFLCEIFTLVVSRKFSVNSKSPVLHEVMKVLLIDNLILKLS